MSLENHSGRYWHVLLTFIMYAGAVLPHRYLASFVCNSTTLDFFKLAFVNMVADNRGKNLIFEFSSQLCIRLGIEFVFIVIGILEIANHYCLCHSFILV